MKRAGTSLIAFSIASFFLALLDQGEFHCGAALLTLAAFSVRHGSRAGTLWGIVFSVLYLYAAIAVIVAAASQGVREIAAYRLLAWLVLGVWAWVNWILLLGCREALHGHILAGGELRAGVSPPAVPRFQFTLRSMLLLTVIVALACWTGTRPLPPEDSQGRQVVKPQTNQVPAKPSHSDPQE